MASGMRKGVALNWRGTDPIPQPFGGYQQFDYHDDATLDDTGRPVDNRRYIAIDSRSQWVLFWVSWRDYVLAPDWSVLDRNVKACNDYGVKVILRVYQSPDSANGGNGQYGVPTDRSVSGPWARFLDSVMRRYHPLNPFRPGVVHAVEMMNEPNGQWRPQTADIHLAVADMMVTAKTVKDAIGFGVGPVLLAPASDDHAGVDTFTTNLLKELARRNFKPGPEFVWSQHNHNDIEGDRGASTNQALNTRDLLMQSWPRPDGTNWHWEGWPLENASRSALFLTEGSARLDQIGGTDKQAEQDRLLKNAWNRMSAGTNIEMFLWYQSNTMWDWDSGLREQDARTRRTAWNTWTDMTKTPPGAGFQHWHGWHNPNLNIPGTPGIQGGPDACSWDVNRLDVFWCSSSNHLGHTWFNGSWNSEELGGSVFIDDPSAVAWGPGRIDVFARAANSSCIHRAYVSGFGWTDFFDNLGGTMIYGPDACSWAANRLDVFCIGTDGGLYHKYWNGSTWLPSQTGWENLGKPAGGALTSAPTAVSWGPGRIDVFVRGPGNTLYQKLYDGTWSLWIQHAENNMNSAPDACSWGPGRLDVFWLTSLGSDNALAHKWYDGSSWSFERLGGGQVTSAPAAVSWSHGSLSEGAGRVDVFAKGGAGTLMHSWWE